MAPTFPSRRLASAFASASASASTPSHGKRPLGLALLRRRKATSGNSFDARRGRAQKNACVAPSSSSSATQVEDESEIFSKLLETSFNIQGAANNGLGCRVEVIGGELKLVSSRALAAGEVILRVPIDATLSESMFEDIFDSDESLDGLETWMKIVLVLMHIKNSRSEEGEEMKWRPVLDKLDTERFRKHPLLWSDEDLSELNGTQTLAKLQSYKEYLESMWQQMEEYVFPVLGMDYARREDFFWAFGVLKTNALRPFSQPQTLRIIPMLNMITHGRQPNSNTKFASSGIFKKDETLDLLATRDIGEGEVVSYDFDPTKGEIDILTDYGAFDVLRPSGGLELTLELDEDDFNFDEKCDVVEEVAKLSVVQGFAISEGDIPEDLFAFLRLIQLKDADAFLLEPVFRKDVWDFMKNPVSIDNEGNVCKSMIQSCKDALADFPTTIDEDEEALKTLVSNSRTRNSQRRMAVETRLVEKRAFRALLNYFTKEKSQLSLKEYYHERRLKSLGLLDLDGNSTF
mmetsp:Transcript_8444/g.15655  ORF Transcript_8444/g.15655 Transcript_8444/m.15655 type:complete len:517 (+) Transcript_8444:84-1634(+)